VDPVLGSLVYQLPGGVTLAYDLLFGAHDSSLERYHQGDSFWGLNQSLWLSLRCSIPKKPSFRPSKWPQKFRNRKTAKNSKLPENCFEPVGIGGWPPISTWINPPSLGRNGLHCIEFPGEREKRLLNLHLDELLALLEKLCCLAC
jgi:hypothetical protein